MQRWQVEYSNLYVDGKERKKTKKSMFYSNLSAPNGEQAKVSRKWAIHGLSISIAETEEQVTRKCFAYDNIRQGYNCFEKVSLRIKPPLTKLGMSFLSSWPQSWIQGRSKQWNWETSLMFHFSFQIWLSFSSNVSKSLSTWLDTAFCSRFVLMNNIIYISFSSRVLWYMLSYMDTHLSQVCLKTKEE